MLNSNYHFAQKILKLSIIIVNYKVKDQLLQCLSSIYQMLKGLNFEVMVVDNASGDDTPEKIKKNYPLVRMIVNSKNFGFSKGCNQALKEMRGEFALLLNPDTKLLDQNFRGMIRFLEENPKVGIIGCKILDEMSKEQRSAFPKPTPLKEILDIIPSLKLSFKLEKVLPANFTNRFYDRLIIGSEKPFEVFWVSGACLLIRKRVLEEVGLLDENFFLFSEDVDLAWRAKRSGWKVMFYPQAKILHTLGASSFEDPESLYLRLLHSYTRRTYFGHKYYNKLGNWLVRLVMSIDLLVRLIYINFGLSRERSIEREEAKKKAYFAALKSVLF